MGRPCPGAHPEGPVARWDVCELIARVLDHLPPPHPQLVRYWGYHSNVSRGKRPAQEDCGGKGAGSFDPEGIRGGKLLSPAWRREAVMHVRRDRAMPRARGRDRRSAATGAVARVGLEEERSTDRLADPNPGNDTSNKFR